MRDRAYRWVAASLIVATASTLSIGLEASPASGRPSRLTYRCTLAVTDLGSRIRVAYRLTSDGPRQRWRVRLWDGSVRFYSEDVKTDGEGALRVVARTADSTGVDHLRGSARHLLSGRTCAVSING